MKVETSKLQFPELNMQELLKADSPEKLHALYSHRLNAWWAAFRQEQWLGLVRVGVRAGRTAREAVDDADWILKECADRFSAPKDDAGELK